MGVKQKRGARSAPFCPAVLLTLLGAEPPATLGREEAEATCERDATDERQDPGVRAGAGEVHAPDAATADADVAAAVAEAGDVAAAVAVAVAVIEVTATLAERAALVNGVALTDPLRLVQVTPGDAVLLLNVAADVPSGIGLLRIAAEVGRVDPTLILREC